MTMTLKKVFADLRSSPGRTLLVILALAIGIWGVGGILVSYVILTRDLSANFMQTRPPHAILTSNDFARLNLADLRARPDVEKAEFRDLSLQRIEVRPDEWIPLWLFGVEDFNHPELAVTYAEKGARVPPPGTMLIERDGRLISDLDLGSRARVRVGPTLRIVPVSGITFDPAQAPATQDHFIYAYVDKTTFSEITGEPANRRLILRLRGVKTKQEVQAVVDRLLGDFKAQGVGVESLKIPKLNEHPHQWQLNTLLLLQGGIGLLAFLMGAVLVSQLMASILARQVREIGVLKAIGGTRRQVLAIYLIMALALGIAAGAIAIPLAVWSGYAFSYFVAGKINFEILTQQLPIHVYLLLAAVSLLLPIGLSSPAILRGTRVSVHDALSDYGISVVARGAATGSRLSSRLPRNLLLAIRNSLRRKKRLALTVMTMALGVAIFSTGFNVRESLTMLLTDVRTSMKHDVQVVLNNQMDRVRALAVFRGIGNVQRIETWNGGRGELQSQVVAAAGGSGIVALPHDSDLFRPRVVAGRWLRVADLPEVVMNQQAVELYHRPAVGSVQTLGVGGKTLAVRLVGVVEELEKPKIYMDQSQYDAVANPEHHVNSLMFIARDSSYDKVMTLKRDLEAAIVSSDLSVLYVMSQAERVKVIYDHLSIILTTIVFLSLSVLVVSALGMASATGINILERTREIGVLRAIGATPRLIFQLFVAEGMIISVASVVLGLLLAWPLSKVAAVFFGTLMLGEGAVLRYAFSGAGFLITLVTALIFGWLASRVPARFAIQVSTRDALSYE
ncbi:MAG: ABC transporter permease [Betaproteobacteria bacterium]|nr:ABC transporter permease [Betaproteobacteria bacterium]